MTHALGNANSYKYLICIIKPTTQYLHRLQNYKKSLYNHHKADMFHRYLIWATL